MIYKTYEQNSKNKIKNGNRKKIDLSSLDFKKEKEEFGYLRTVGRTAVKWQSSIMTLMAPTLKLYENGYYEDIRDVYVENYWAWSEKMADMLPYDYTPDINKRKTK